MSIKGIDLSGNNGPVDWRAIANDGVKFAFLKVNEGDWIDKTTTATRVLAAKRAGLLVGGYDFARPREGRTGGQEFDIFYKRAEEVGLLGTGGRTLRPVLDIEATGFPDTPLGRLKTRRYVRSWIKRCVERTGQKPIIYTGQWFWDGRMKGNKYTTQGCKLWLAAYVSEAKLPQFTPKGFDTISFWQHTDQGAVKGVRGRCDVNAYRGTLASLRKVHVLRPRGK